MIKSKHFRKDVIIARIIFLCLCVALVIGIVWLVSKLTDGSGNGGQGSESENTGYIDSESESESESEIESESPTEPETETGTEPGTEPDTQPDTEPEVTVPKYVQVTAKNLRLRAEPNTNCDTITSLDKGEKAEVLEVLDGWYKVTYEGNEGYLSADYVKEVEE